MSSPLPIPLGPVMLDIAGTTLAEDERERLLHPLVGGLTLFTRNYESPEQLKALTGEIHALRQPPLLIAVDHEGGRVQRFREGFTVLPAMRELGACWDHDAKHARELARQVGFVMAAELRAHDVDLSLAPVLDVDHAQSSVIGDRAFHSDVRAISELAIAVVQGMRRAGMSSVGKHFPGHGHVKADSHVEVSVDERPLAAIEATDLVPFRRLIANHLGGIMPAHVVYPAVDDKSAGFSEVWLKKILRDQLGFGGTIFSDDLSMEGACGAGNVVARAQAALAAGCDIILVCNNPTCADELLAELDYDMPAVAMTRIARIHGPGGAPTSAQLQRDRYYLAAVEAVRGMSVHSGELPLYR
jgi:beta-N-acetylhexosaminidase